MIVEVWEVLVPQFTTVEKNVISALDDISAVEV